MKFQKYGSIENSYREKEIDRIRYAGHANKRWALTEKIHGANFSFWTDGTDVQVASRSQFVDGTFYNCQEVIDRYRDDVLYLWENYFSGPALNVVLTIYGELFGEGIQKGIRYGSGKDFRVFDMAINGIMIPPAKAQAVLDHRVSLRFVPVHSIHDSMDQALAVSPHFVSLLGAERGIVDDGNTSEGFIAVPWEEACYAGQSRAILKIKDDKWKERSRKAKPPRVPKAAKHTSLIAEFVNVPRLDAVLSKRGKVTAKDFGSIIKDMSQDVLEDMVKDEAIPADWRQLDDYADLGKEINQVVVPFLKKELLPKL